MPADWTKTLAMPVRKEPTHNHTLTQSPSLSAWIGGGIIFLGLIVGVIAVAEPRLLALGIGAVVCLAVLAYSFSNLEQVVFGLLILRSAIDFLPGVPAMAGIGLTLLTLTYVVVQLLTGNTIQTDRFWWFFAGWVLIQGLWVILIPLGGLGFSEDIYLGVAIREWTRLLSWLMIYLLFMQLKGKISPEKAINLLACSLAIPLTVALIQLVVPGLLPPLLQPTDGILEDSYRIKGTFVVSGAFTKYLFMFVCVAWWKASLKHHRLRWIGLLGVLVFFLIMTRSATTLLMFTAFAIFMSITRIKIRTILVGIMMLLIVSIYFLSTEYGQVRLTEILSTPLLNPDVSFSRSILLQNTGGLANTTYWRVDQWYGLLQEWQKSPWLGYGLGTTEYLSRYNNIAHNDYIRALAETGIIGLGTFLTFMVAQFIHLFELIANSPKNSSQHEFCKALLGLLIVSALGMLTDNMWRGTVTYTYWWSLLAMAGWQWHGTPIQKGDSINTCLTTGIDPPNLGKL